MRTTKEIPPAIVDGYLNKLKNKLFALLCERENGGQWTAFLDNLYIEVFGAEELLQTINYIELKAKMGALRYLDYPYFRSCIFDCLTLLSSNGHGK